MKTQRSFVQSSFQLGAVLTAVILACTAGAATAQTTRAAIAAGTAASSNVAETAPRAASGPRATTSADRTFIEDTARDGIAEVEMGKIAQRRATDAQVKAFAERMVRDHATANAELAQLAAGKGMRLSVSLDDEQRRYADALSKMTGADFDRAYMKRMVGEHEKDVSDFRKFAGATQDAELKAFATRTLATMEIHLGTARSTHHAVDKRGQGKGVHTAVVLPAASAASR